mgnify:CR=1 FL=1
MMKQKITCRFNRTLHRRAAPLQAGMAAAPVAAEDTTEPVRILAMGDSITDGYINGDNGYRKYFWLRNAAKRVYQFRYGRTEKQLV